jgi:ribosomal protein S27E
MAGTFLKVKCKCGTETMVYANTTTPVDCSSCKEKIAVPTGGRAVILGTIVK